MQMWCSQFVSPHLASMSFQQHHSSRDTTSSLLVETVPHSYVEKIGLDCHKQTKAPFHSSTMVDKLPTQPPLDTDERPSSLAECFNDDGELWIQEYRDFLQREEEEDSYEMNMLNSFVMSGDDDDNNQPKKKKRNPRTCKTRQPFYIDDDGVKRTFDPRQSMWFLYYIQHPPFDEPKFHHKFRKTISNASWWIHQASCPSSQQEKVRKVETWETGCYWKVKVPVGVVAWCSSLSWQRTNLWWSRRVHSNKRRDTQAISPSLHRLRLKRLVWWICQNADKCRWVRDSLVGASTTPRPLIERPVSTSHGDDVDRFFPKEPDEISVDDNGCIKVNSLRYEDFRRRLVCDFDILWRQHKIVWPTEK